MIFAAVRFDQGWKYNNAFHLLAIGYYFQFRYSYTYLSNGSYRSNGNYPSNGNLGRGGRIRNLAWDVRILLDPMIDIPFWTFADPIIDIPVGDFKLWVGFWIIAARHVFDWLKSRAGLSKQADGIKNLFLGGKLGFKCAVLFEGF